MARRCALLLTHLDSFTALMEDQVKALRKLNIRCAMFTSKTDPEEVKEVRTVSMKAKPTLTGVILLDKAGSTVRSSEDTPPLRCVGSAVL